jgi:hypothetical protein
MLTRFFMAFALAYAAFTAPPARANALSDSWSCAKNAGMTAVKVQTDIYKKGEAIAANAGPIASCLARTGPEGQALMITSSALTALRLAKPTLLGNQCEVRIKGIATKPFALGIATLMPASSAKQNLINAASSPVATEIVWSQIGQTPPPVSMVPNQIECGCLLSDNALSLTDVSEVTNAIAKTSASCGKMLDSLGLGFVNDIGSYASKLATKFSSNLSGYYDEVFNDQTDPEPPATVFKGLYGDRIESVAKNMANYPTNWQAQTYSNTKNFGCDGYNMNEGKWEGICNPNFPQIFEICVDYYDDHKMSKSNATKTCTSYRDAIMPAATARSKQLAAIAALPPLVAKNMDPWVKQDWLWRMPKTYSPGYYDYEKGNVGGYAVLDPTGTSLRMLLIDVLGSPYLNAKTAKAGEKYEATHILANARDLVIELGNDPQRAVDLAYAAADQPLRDKVRTVWIENRKYYGLFQLREWYPMPAFGFRYGCPGDLGATCAAAMEARFDTSCFTPASDAYITTANALGMVVKLAEAKKACTPALTTIISNANALIAGEQAATAGMCPGTGTRDENGACAVQAHKTYLECANIALKQGKDSAAKCLVGRQIGNQLLQQLQKGFTLPGQKAATPPPETAPAPQTRCDPNGIASCPQ